MQLRSLHVIGSKTLGGAERWFLRFPAAMARHGESVEAVVRRGGELARPGLMSVPVHQMPMHTVWDPVSKASLAKLIRHSDASIVQTYMGRATRLIRLAPGRRPVHVSRLGGYYKVDPFCRAHAWIGNTKRLCSWMVQQGLPANRVFHIYNFADSVAAPDVSQLADMRDRLGIRPEDWTLVTAGRMIEVKGHRYLIEALARVPGEVAGRRPRLIILGEGELRGRLEEQARQLGVMDRIHWAGWQYDPSPWFHLADMVVFPSNDAETLGNVILEAWAYGKPLVCTAFRGAREIARHGEDAWIVPCGDSVALARGIESVIRNGEIGPAMVLAGRRRVEREFGEAAIIAQYRELYRYLVDSVKP